MANIAALAKNKEFLESLIANDYKLPDEVDAYPFCIELTRNLGSPDPVFRDELTSTILDHFVSDPEFITGDQAGRILAVCLDDDHLLEGIGEQNTDSVFMRSFSALISSSIIDRDSREQELDPEFIRDSINRLLHYSKMERDLRGFVHHKGWAHSVAHLSDAFFASANHPSALPEQLMQILDATGRLSGNDYPMSSGECDRLAYAACSAIIKVGDMENVKKWIDSYAAGKEIFGTVYRLNNTKSFLRSLYFVLKWESSDTKVLDSIEGKLRSLDPLYRNRNIE